jgi:hypothetical protein
MLVVLFGVVEKSMYMCDGRDSFTGLDNGWSKIIRNVTYFESRDEVNYYIKDKHPLDIRVFRLEEKNINNKTIAGERRLSIDGGK